MHDQPHGLAVFDLNGTLLRGLTVCEVLAGPLGRLDRMQQFEAPLHASALDIAAAREEMAGWYRAVPLADLTALLETATVAPGAAEAVALLRQHGIAVAIASITWEFAVAWFAQRLRAGYYVGTRLAGDGTDRAYRVGREGRGLTHIREAVAQVSLCLSDRASPAAEPPADRLPATGIRGGGVL